ncbi:MAG: ribosome biogenesis GTPase Der [Bacilli bacterium]|nr:ribosome biogenesis GTPase Der [Bacilli bacterium]
MSLGTVAIIGSPNVGKSSLFNRIMGFQKSIVSNIAGTTRDRLYGLATWLNNNFFLIDTGGISHDSDNSFSLQKQIEFQTKIAIEEADIIIFLVDGNIGITSDDKIITKKLFKSGKKIFLAVNKIDSINQQDNVNEFYQLGLKPKAISSIHNLGIEELLGDVVNYLKNINKNIVEDLDAIKFSIIGKQNVGKSTLVNALSQQTRVIVSEIPGTTRDAVETIFTYNKKKYIVIDTAGLKKRGKNSQIIDKISSFKTFRAITNSEIVLFVIDIVEGISELDKHIAGYILNKAMAVIIVVNKCDVNNDLNSLSFSRKIKENFKFLNFANIVFISAFKKYNIEKIFFEINIAYQNLHKKIEQDNLNNLIENITTYNEPPLFNGGRIKIFSIKQLDTIPPTFVLYVNNKKFMHFSYMRYIENEIRKKFPFTNSVVKIILENKINLTK